MLFCFHKNMVRSRTVGWRQSGTRFPVFSSHPIALRFKKQQVIYRKVIIGLCIQQTEKELTQLKLVWTCVNSHHNLMLSPTSVIICRALRDRAELTWNSLEYVCGQQHVRGSRKGHYFIDINFFCQVRGNRANRQFGLTGTRHTCLS